MWSKAILTLIVIQKPKIPLYSFIKSLTYLNVSFHRRFGGNNETEKETHEKYNKNKILKCHSLISLTKLEKILKHGV